MEEVGLRHVGWVIARLRTDASAGAMEDPVMRSGYDWLVQAGSTGNLTYTLKVAVIQLD
jgi:hypothetical protein